MSNRSVFIFALVVLACAYLAHGAKFKGYNLTKLHKHHFLQKIKTPLGETYRHSVYKSPETCSKETINVYLVPHTHDDVGWLKTVDQYYWGDRDDIQRAGVQYVIDNVIQQLAKNSTRKFIYVEVAFWQKWWKLQNQKTKDLVTSMIKSGQLEFINGGYCMNDEAAPYYEDVIDQMTIGHQWLLNNHGVIPTIGWQIDPFGHANAQAALFAQMGFNAVFFSRIDYQDLKARLDNQTMEMVWIPRTAMGDENQILAHVQYFKYEAPPTFCFDINCEDQPIMDDPRLEGYNLDRKVEDFVKYFKDECLHYRTNNVMHTMGSDFQYRIAQQNFKNMDKLVHHIQANFDKYNLNMTYQTPTTYVKSVFEAKPQLPVKVDDFFPYADVPNGFWTGYFISRTALKHYIREVGRWSQVFKKFVGLALIQKSSEWVNTHQKEVLAAVQLIDEAMGINQHHDAVAGTAKQAVTEDYYYTLYKGHKKTVEILQNILNDQTKTNRTYSTCTTNMTAAHCNVTWSTLKTNTPVTLSLYHGSSSRAVNIRVKVPHGYLKVTNDDGSREIVADVICANSTDDGDCDLQFTETLAAFSWTNYKIVKSDKSIAVTKEKTIDPAHQERVIKFNDDVTFTVKYSNKDFTLTLCKGGKDCKDYPFALDYRYYISYVAPKDSKDRQNSGAYIFRPNAETLNRSLPYDKVVTSYLYKGKSLTQIRIEWEKMVTDLRFYTNDPSSIEVDTFVGPINVDDGNGKELTINFQTDFDNNKVFWTDSYGMEMQNRTVDYRETWTLNQTQPASGNYYPINSAIYLEDKTKDSRMTVLVDRSQGGSSLVKGEIEIMIQRRTLKDDARGVEEPLNETDWDGKGQRQWMKHTLIFSSVKEGTEKQRTLQFGYDQPPLALLSAQPAAAHEKKIKIGEDIPLPKGVKIYIRPFESDTYVVRFHNLNESATVEFDAPAFFNSFKNVTETTLTANQPKDQMLKNKFIWNDRKIDISKIKLFTKEAGKINLRPLEIRTILLKDRATAHSVGKGVFRNIKKIAHRS